MCVAAAGQKCPDLLLTTLQNDDIFFDGADKPHIDNKAPVGRIKARQCQHLPPVLNSICAEQIACSRMQQRFALSRLYADDLFCPSHDDTLGGENGKFPCFHVVLV